MAVLETIFGEMCFRDASGVALARVSRLGFNETAVS